MLYLLIVFEVSNKAYLKRWWDDLKTLHVGSKGTKLGGIKLSSLILSNLLILRGELADLTAEKSNLSPMCGKRNLLH